MNLLVFFFFQCGERGAIEHKAWYLLNKSLMTEAHAKPVLDILTSLYFPYLQEEIKNFKII